MKIPNDLLEYVKVRSVIDPVTGCWNWQGATAGGGRPYFTYRRRVRIVYRELWAFLHKVALDKSDFVCHSCDNGLCCNPDHLFQGNAAINNQDAVSKGRTFAQKDRAANRAAMQKGVQWRKEHPEVNPRGAAHWMKRHPEWIRSGEEHWTSRSPEKIKRGSRIWNSKFTEAQVATIRADTRTLKAIAADYGCHYTTIGYIRSGKHYGVSNIAASALRLAKRPAF